MTPAELPDSVRAVVEDDDLAKLFIGVGPWHVGRHTVAFALPGEGHLEQRSARLQWLAGRTPVPLVVVDEINEDGHWLVTEKLDGEPADQLESLGDIQGLIELVARSLRQVHELDPSNFPFATGWDSLRIDIETRHYDGEIDASRLPEPYSRYDGDRLVELWAKGRPTKPEDLVVCHGAPTLSNFFVDGQRLVGLDGVDHLRVADRHLDLAIIHRSLHETLGGESPLIFFDAYGIDPGLVELDHYVLADFLRSAKPA